MRITLESMIAQLSAVFTSRPLRLKIKISGAAQLTGLTIFALTCAVPLQSQIVNLNNEVATPIPGSAHDYIKGLSETVSPSNGNLSIKIDLPMPPSRGLTMPFAYTYNSGETHRFTSPIAGCGNIDNSGGCGGAAPAYADRAQAGRGWSDTIPYTSASSWDIVVSASPAYQVLLNCPITSSYNFYDSSGVGHSLSIAALGVGVASSSDVPPGGCGQTNTGALSKQTGSDGEVSAKMDSNCNGLYVGVAYPVDCTYAAPSFTVTDLDSTTYYFPGGVAGFSSSANNSNPGPAISSFIFPTKIEDRNGNIINFTVPANAVAAELPVTDTNGRQSITMSHLTGAPGSTSYKVGDLTYTVAYTTASATYTSPSLQQDVFSVEGEGYSCTVYTEANSESYPVISSIKLPNGQAYTFDYSDPYGLVSEIDYPDGGRVIYEWTLTTDYNAAAFFDALKQQTSPYTDGCDYRYKTPVISERDVYSTAGSTSPDLTQKFVYTTVWNTSPSIYWSTKTTTVTTTDNIMGRSSIDVYTYKGVENLEYQPISNGKLFAELAEESTIQYYDWGQAVGSTPIQTVTKQWANLFVPSAQTTTWNSGPTSGYLYCYNAPNGANLATEIDEYSFGQTIPGVTSSCTTYSGAYRQTKSTYNGL
jgi:YD repeat-containing protein